jgi:Chemotaxis phosphatase CheX
MAELSPKILAQALERLLEDAAFVFAEATEEPPPHEDAVIQAHLAYAGPEDGELVLAASPDLAATLAANLLGEDEGGAIPTGDDEDAIGELLNMLAGSLLVDLYGPDARWRLGLPEVRRVAVPEHERALASASAAVTLVEEEGRRIDLAARVGGRAR